jgi:hypothetical protein
MESLSFREEERDRLSWEEVCHPAGTSMHEGIMQGWGEPQSEQARGRWSRVQRLAEKKAGTVCGHFSSMMNNFGKYENLSGRCREKPAVYENISLTFSSPVPPCLEWICDKVR